eukprot:Gb_12996 [translate_table: standard]
MTSDFYRWEVDPFFSAAEDVQDSADRMESVYRTWLHHQTLAEADPTDMELTSSIEFRRRELLTALGTAKWQLEDFERAVKLTSLTHKTYSSDDAPSRHMQFIMAIQNQIAGIEKALQDSITKEGNRSLQWVDLDDQDRDDLAMFLSGSRASKNSVDHSICRNVTEHQLKGNIAAASNVQDTEDMVELRLDDTPLLHEEPGQSNLQSARQSDTNCACALDVHLNGFTATGLINKDSEFAPELAHRVAETRDDWRTGGSVERATGHKRSASAGTECGAWKIAIADDDIGNNSSNCRSERIRNGLNFWSLFSNLNITPKLKLSKSGMKKWKDGEASTIHSLKDEQLLPASNAVCHVELGLNSWLGGNSKILNGYDLPCEDNSDDKQLHGWAAAVQRRLQRSQYFVQYSRLRPVRITSAVLVMLGLLGLFTFHVT